MSSHLIQILLGFLFAVIQEFLFFHGHVFNVCVDVFEGQFKLLLFTLELFPLLTDLLELLDDWLVF